MANGGNPCVWSRQMEEIAVSSPAISVVVGVRNEVLTVRESIESVLTQDGVDLECVVVDDGSTDGTSEILREIAARDNRVRLFSSAGGLTRALIAGCREARGELIARQDCGDYSLPGRLRKEATPFSLDDEVGVVCCATEFVGPEGDFLYVSRGNCGTSAPTTIAPVSAESRTFVGPSHHGAVMFRRSAYDRAGGYRAEFLRGQDWDLWYRIGECWKFQMVPDVCYRATIRPSGVSFARRREQEAFAALSFEAWLTRQEGNSDIGILERAANLKETCGHAAPSAMDESRAWYFLGECLRRNGNPRAREYLARAVRSHPANWKAWIRWAQAFLRRRR